MANSPRAREFERLAAESRERAQAYMAEHGVDETDSVAAYILRSAAYYERRARETQAKADMRAAKREKRDG